MLAKLVVKGDQGLTNLLNHDWHATIAAAAEEYAATGHVGARDVWIQGGRAAALQHVRARGCERSFSVPGYWRTAPTPMRSRPRSGDRLQCRLRRGSGVLQRRHDHGPGQGHVRRGRARSRYPIAFLRIQARQTSCLPRSRSKSRLVDHFSEFLILATRRVEEVTLRDGRSLRGGEKRGGHCDVANVRTGSSNRRAMKTRSRSSRSRRVRWPDARHRSAVAPVVG